MNNIGEKVAELSKRRGFFFQTSESYGGVGGFQTFGPEGAELKRKIENSWRETFSRELGHREIEAPTIMQEEVFRASGHLDGFDDMIIECPECGKSTRADHLVEDNTDVEEAEGFSTDQIEALIEEHELVCPGCDEDLSDVEVDDFNLMFETSIGPGSSQKGYMRPETAQGIFTEFPRLKEYERNQLPFGITQIGKAYRNEISPRKGLVRVREFTQAELEHFIDPEEDEPPISEVKDVKLNLFSRERQESGDDPVRMTVKQAVEKDVVESEWIAYYLGIARKWYQEIGVDMERFRFRQHQNDELSHYASDCWDAETDIGGEEEEWLEITGFAYRGCYDLSNHAEHSGDDKDFRIFKEYDQPRTVERKTVNPDMGYLGPEFGDKAGEIADKLEKLADNRPEVFEEDDVTVELNGEDIKVPTEKCNFKNEEIEKTGEHILPHVVEPSFGIGRALYTVLIHSYDEDEIDGEERRVLRLSDEVAPTEVAVFPMMNKDGMPEKAESIADKLRDLGFSVKYDDTGNIGKRYRRQDEVGTPYCVTIDYETLEDEPETVTIRDRDSTDQERVRVSQLEEELSSRL